MPDLFYTNPESLASLLQDLDEGKLVLPAFQRRFGWDNKRQDALLRSMINSYPAGSLLFLEQPSEEGILGKRLIKGVNPSRLSVRPTRIILDGQQRLTTLYHILYGAGGPWTRRALIDLNKAETFFDSNGRLPQSNTDTGQQLVKDALIHTYGDFVRRKYGSLTQQFEGRILSLTCVFNKEGPHPEGHIGVGEWKYMFAQHWEPKDSDKRFALMKKLNEIERRFIEPIQEYRIPVVILTRNTGPPAVCQVFVDLNIQQKPLNPFEVVAAKVWPFGIDLYKKFEESLSAHPNLKDFSISRVLPLQAISLLQTSYRARTDLNVQVRCTRTALYDLQPQNFESLWDATINSLDWCLGLLKGEAGVLVPKWLPYSALLVAMSATVALSKEAAVSATSLKQKLLRWFWCSVFAGTYAGATNTQNARNFQQLTHWIRGGSPPYTVSAFSSLFSPAVLRTVATPVSGQYQGVICLLLRQHAKDFYTKQGINTSLILQEEIDDHHIFPNSYLEKQGVDSITRNCVLNRALIDAHTNSSIGAKPPSLYLNQIKQQKGEDWLKEVLESQLLPTTPDSGLFQDDFERFLDEREKRLAKEISKVTS